MKLPAACRRDVSAAVLVALLLVAAVAAPGPAGAAAAGAQVVSRGSGRCLTVDRGSDAPTTPVVVESCDGRAGQAWTYADPDGDGVESLTVFGGTRCLDGRYLQAALRVVIEPCSGAGSQHVLAHPAGFLQLDGGRYCPTLRGGATAAGTPVELQPCAGTLAFLWRSSTFPEVTDPPSPPSDLSTSDLTCDRVTLH